MLPIWLLAAYCSLLLLAAACCCLPAAYLLLLTCCSPRLVALGSPPRGDTQGKQKTSIAFRPSRILARSVSFSCQVSTHRRFLISISWECTNYSHNGAGCYVYELVPNGPKIYLSPFPQAAQRYRMLC